MGTIAQPTVLGTDLADGNYVKYDPTNIGVFIYQYRLQATNNAGSTIRKWEFASGTAAVTSYNPVWRPYTTNLLSINNFIDVGFANGARYNTGGGVSGQLPAITANNYYTFNVTKLAGVDNQMQLLETNFNPSLITAVTQSPTAAAVANNNMVAVTVTMATPPAVGENVFIRYTTNGFTSSTLLQCAFIGNKGMAYIPCQSAGTTLQYYVLSSNETFAGIMSDVTAYGAIGYDLATLNFNTNGGANYSYTVGAASTSTFWVGAVNTDWNNVANWGCQGIPTTSTNVIVNAGLANYPNLTTGSASANNITVATGASVTVASLGVFNLYGNITGNDNFDVSAGFLYLRSSAVALSGFGIKNKTVKDLIIGASCGLTSTVGDTVKLTNTLSFGTASNAFNCNGNLTLVSTATATASIVDITNNGTTPGNSIIGQANVERHIATARKWHFLSINTFGAAQTIQNSWMEGQPAGTIGISGRGTWVTDPSGMGNGFDATSFFASMKWPIGNNFTDITNPSTYNINSKDNYFLFVRGDRNAQGNNAIANSTTLRTKGELKYNIITPTVLPIPLAYYPLANPYASTIDLTKLNHVPVGASVTVAVWDPKLTSGYGLGAYQYLSSPNGTSDFTILLGGGSYGPSGSVVNKIESGQAFFIQGTGTVPRQLTFVETAKTAKQFDVFFTAGNPQYIKSTLSIIENNEITPMDALMVQYSQTANNQIDGADAAKLTNTAENCAINNQNTLLAIERRGLIQNNDTLQLNLTGLRLKKYRWSIDISNLDEPGRTAILWDRYLGTQQALLLNAVNQIDFEATNLTASTAPNRFYITFKQNVIPALSILLTAEKIQTAQIKANWVATNEAYVTSYKLEKGETMGAFSTIESRTATNNNGQVVLYSALDTSVTKKVQYYRVKANLANGTVILSNIVRITGEISEKFVKVYPNPVQNGSINLTLANQPTGVYNAQLIDAKGKLVYNSTINVGSNYHIESLAINSAIQAGIYSLVIKNKLGELAAVINIFIK